jgi:very-short-patch-repair endonuclease
MLAAVLACGDDALLSHRSAAELWGLSQTKHETVEVTALRGRRRTGIGFHEAGVHADERTMVDAIPITTVERTLLDLAEVADERTLRIAFEEAERLRRLDMGALEAVLARGYGRRGLKPLKPLVEDARGPVTRSPLEDRVVELCRQHGLPLPRTNAIVLGREVDAFWPDQRLMVEADGFEFHGHRAAFERDRARDAAMQAAGYRVVRLTHRRLEREPAKVAAELNRLLNDGRAGS